MARTSEEDATETESDSEEVFSDLSRTDLELCLSESLKRYQKLQRKFKDLKKALEYEVEESIKLEKEVSKQKDENFVLD